MIQGHKQECWVDGMHFNSMEDVYEELGCTNTAQRQAVRRAMAEGAPYVNQKGDGHFISLEAPAQPRREEKPHTPGTPLFSPCRHRLGCSEAGV